MVHKKVLLSIAGFCIASLSMAQSITIPVTLPDTVVTKVVQDHIIQMVTGTASTTPAPVAKGVQRAPATSTITLSQPDKVAAKSAAQKGGSATPSLASPTRLVVDTIRRQTVVQQVDTVRRVVVVEQQMPQYGTINQGVYTPRSSEPVMRGRHIERVSREDLNATFVPKGQWMLGASLNYQEWDNNETDLLVLKNLNLEGHSYSVSPAFGYFVSKNIAIGARYSYSRNYFFLGDFDLSLGEDFNISLQDLYYLNQKHSGSVFMRAYMPLFGSRTLGFFSEVGLNYTHSVGKNSTGDPAKENFDGVYETSQSVGLGFTPGICLFTNNFAAVECSVGILGLNYRWTDQKHYEDNADEPVTEKRSQSGGANFKINIFSVNLGMTFYF